MLEVIGYPPPRRWWQLWIPSRPVVLRPGTEYQADASGETVEIFKPRRGWNYRVAFVRA